MKKVENIRNFGTCIIGEINVNGYKIINVDREVVTGFIVARLSDDCLWFYGDYATYKDAERVVIELGAGVIIDCTN